MNAIDAGADLGAHLLNLRPTSRDAQKHTLQAGPKAFALTAKLSSAPRLARGA